MEQLLKITSIPIQYELKVNNARLEMKKGSADVEIKRNKGGLHIKSNPVKVKLDTFEARNSMVPSPMNLNREYAQRGRQAAMDATAQFADEGRILLRTKNGEGAQTIDQICAMRTESSDGQFKLGFIPEVGANIDWEGPELTIEYNMDKMNFDWKINKGDIEFVPGSIEMTINEYPRIDIEYMGDPLYVPPSAAEMFSGEHIDVKA